MTLTEAKAIVDRVGLSVVKEATTYSGRSARFDINRKIIEYIGNDKLKVKSNSSPFTVFIFSTP